MKNIILVRILVIFCMSIYAQFAFSQMNIGQYEDEAPLGTWNKTDGLSFAYARDITAVTANPALINRLSDFTVAVRGFFNNTSMHQFAVVNTGILTSQDNPSLYVYGLDFGGAALHLNRFGIALTTSIQELYDRPNIVSEYESGGAVQRKVSFQQDGYQRNTNLSFSYIFSNSIAAGVGLNLVSGNLDRTLEDYFAYLDDLVISDIRSQTFSGFYVNAGITIDVSPAIRLAAAVRSPYEKKAEGESLSRYHIAELGTDIQIKSEEDSRYRQPMMAAAGVNLQITPQFRADANVAFFNWDHYEVDYFGLGQVRDFKNILQAGINIEYNGAMSLFGRDFEIPVWTGFLYDPQPMQSPSSFYTSILFGSGIRSGGIYMHFNTQIGSEHGSGDSLQTRYASVTVGYELR